MSRGVEQEVGEPRTSSCFFRGRGVSVFVNVFQPAPAGNFGHLAKPQSAQLQINSSVGPGVD